MRAVSRIADVSTNTVAKPLAATTCEASHNQIIFYVHSKRI